LRWGLLSAWCRPWRSRFISGWSTQPRHSENGWRRSVRLQRSKAQSGPDISACGHADRCLAAWFALSTIFDGEIGGPQALETVLPLRHFPTAEMSKFPSSRVPMSEPEIANGDIAFVVDALKSRRLSLGPYLRAFEEAFAAFVGTQFAVGVSSGTAGLHA